MAWTLLSMLAAGCVDLERPEDVATLRAAAVAGILDREGWDGDTTVCVEVGDLGSDSRSGDHSCNDAASDQALLLSSVQERDLPVFPPDRCTPTEGEVCNPFLDASGAWASMITVDCPFPADDGAYSVVIDVSDGCAWWSGTCRLVPTLLGWALDECETLSSGIA